MAEESLIVTITRYPEIAFGTFGELVCGEFTCHTLELPWRENQPQVSCIPPGLYRAIWTFSPKFRRPLWRLVNVPGRSGILIHPANVTTELQGCIALGKEYGCYEGAWAILRSNEAVAEFHRRTAGWTSLMVVVRNGWTAAVPNSAGASSGR